MSYFKKKEGHWKKIEGFENGRKIIGDGLDLARLMPRTDFHSVWASPESFYKHVKGLDKASSWGSGDCWDKDSSNFYGTETWADAVKLASEGWREGADLIEKVRDQIKALNPLRPKLSRYGMAGSVPSVPRAVAGNILNMRVPEEGRSKKKPVITLLVNMCVHGGTNHERISNRAATIACLVDEIEAKGYSCEVVATALTDPRDFSAATSIVAKASHQPVDIMRLAFAIGHASLFRRFMFADWYSEPACAKLGWGLGYAKDFKPSEELKEKAVYVIPASGCSQHFKDTKTAATAGLNFIVRSLQEQGCPAFPPFTEAQEEAWKEVQANSDDDDDDDDLDDDF